jgi:hypothetical protein
MTHEFHVQRLHEARTRRACVDSPLLDKSNGVLEVPPRWISAAHPEGGKVWEEVEVEAETVLKRL